MAENKETMAENKEVETFAFQAEVRAAALLAGCRWQPGIPAEQLQADKAADERSAKRRSTSCCR
jgi:hypothetical protein